MDYKEARDKRARLLDDAQKLLDHANAEQRDLTTEENDRFDVFHAEAERLDAMAAKMERQETAQRTALEADERRRLERARQQRQEEPADIQKRYGEAFTNWLRVGVNGLGHEQRQLMARGKADLSGVNPLNGGPEQRVLTTGTGDTAKAGYTVPQDFQAELERAMLDFNGIMRGSTLPGGPRILRTANGQALPWPTVDDTGNEGILLAEGTADTADDIVFGQKQLDAYMYSSRIILVQLQLLQDSAIDVDAEVRSLLAERLGRVTAGAFTVGDGSAKPQGLAEAAADSTVGWSAATGIGSAAADYEKLLDMYHAVDPAYREQGVQWQFNDGIFKKLRKIKDGASNYIWHSGTRGSAMAEPAPPTLLDAPYVINQKMEDDGTAANRPILVGNLRKFIVRLVQDVTLLRLEERYAEYLQVGFIAFMRADSELVEGAAGPVQCAVMDA